MKLLRTLALASASLAFCSWAQASITFVTIGGEEVHQGGSGSPLALSGSLVLFVADTSNDGVFDALGAGSINVGDPVALGSDDIIVSRFDMNGGDGLFAQSLTLSLFGNWTAGDPLGVYWIPSLTMNSTTVSGGTAYGKYFNLSVSGNSAAWITPADPTPGYPSIYFDTTGLAFGDINAAPGTGFASLTVIPEPSFYAALVGSFGLGLVILRRRRQKA